MNHAPKELRDWAHRFHAYFNVADEMSRGLLPGLLLEDLSDAIVEQALQSAQENSLAWPPCIHEAEEFYLRNDRALRVFSD
jgi:hypothetical protein